MANDPSNQRLARRIGQAVLLYEIAFRNAGAMVWKDGSVLSVTRHGTKPFNFTIIMLVDKDGNLTGKLRCVAAAGDQRRIKDSPTRAAIDEHALELINQFST